MREMPIRSVGPKWQVVISKCMREALGLKSGVKVVFELQDKVILIKKPKVSGNYADYFITILAPKLKTLVNLKSNRRGS